MCISYLQRLTGEFVHVDLWRASGFVLINHLIIGSDQDYEVNSLRPSDAYMRQ